MRRWRRRAIPAFSSARSACRFRRKRSIAFRPGAFAPRLSPDLAARREGRSIDVDAVVAYCQGAIERRRDILLIEGVGGIMVPLDEHRTILDVMMALRVPLILVTGSYRGTISHTLTALNSLFRRDMNVLATIVSETPGSSIPLGDVVASIGRFTDAGDRLAAAAPPELTVPAARRHRSLKRKIGPAARFPASLPD